MGLHSSEPLEQRVLDSLVVADLDRGTLHLGKDDGLMKRCLSHPYMRTLERRVRYVFPGGGGCVCSRACVGVCLLEWLLPGRDVVGRVLVNLVCNALCCAHFHLPQDADAAVSHRC